MRKTLFLFLLCGLVGQAQEIDVLKGELNNGSSGSHKANLAYEVASLYTTSDLDSAIHYADVATKLSKQLKDNKLLARSMNLKAGALIRKRSLTEAGSLSREVSSMKEIDSITKAASYHNLATVLLHKAAFQHAMSWSLKAMKIYEAERDSLGIARASTNMGIVHARLGNTGKAITFFEKATSHAQNDESLRLRALANMGAAYSDAKAYIKAIDAIEKAKVLAQELNSLVYLGVINSNLCNNYVEIEAYDAAIAHGLEGLRIKDELGQNTDILLNNLGYAYLKKGDYRQAIHYLSRVSQDSQPVLRSLVYNNLSQSHSGLKSYETAWQYARLHKAINDSLHIVQARQRDSIANLLSSYETERSQQQIDLLNVQNELSESKINAQKNTIWAIGIFAGLLLLSSFLLYKNQKAKQSLKTANIRHRLLQTQLNPHFLFHALNSIQSFIYFNKKEESIDYLTSFSRLMRSVLESSDQDFITVEEDVRSIREYLRLQELNISKAFAHSVLVDEELDGEAIMIPPMFTQPFVENALLHGIGEMDDGKVEIQYEIKKGKLKVMIADNGKGARNKGSDGSRMHRSMSTGILHERMLNLKETHGYVCQVDAISNDSGTQVALTFPARQKKI